MREWHFRVKFLTRKVGYVHPTIYYDLNALKHQAFITHSIQGCFYEEIGYQLTQHELSGNISPICTRKSDLQPIMVMKMINCFCEMVDRGKTFSLISSEDHCQRSSRSRISDTPRAGFEHAQNLSSGLASYLLYIYFFVFNNLFLFRKRFSRKSTLVRILYKHFHNLGTSSYFRLLKFKMILYHALAR